MLTLFCYIFSEKAIQIFVVVVVHIIFNVLQCYVIARKLQGENSRENVDFMEINFPFELEKFSMVYCTTPKLHALFMYVYVFC